jgi:hypothetical protein
VGSKTSGGGLANGSENLAIGFSFRAWAFASPSLSHTA